MADKKFALVFDANMDVSKVKKSVSEIQSALNGLNLSKGMASSASGTFKKLFEELDNYNNLISQTATSMADIKKVDKSLQTILNLFDKVNSIAGEVGENPLSFIDSSELKKINAAKKALEGAKQAMSNTAVAAKKANLQEQFDKAKKKVDDLNDKIGQLNSNITSKKTTKSNIETSLEQAKNDLAELKKELTSLEANPVRLETKTTSKKGVKTTEILNAQEVETYKNKVNDTKAKIAEAEIAIGSLNKKLQTTDTSKLEDELQQVQQESAEASQALDQLGEKLKHVGKDNKSEAIKKLRDELADLTGKAKKDIPQTIDKIEEFVESLEDIEKTKIQQVLKDINRELLETDQTGKKAAEGLDKMANEAEELNRVAQDVDNLKGQILDFFSISNTIQIFKDAIRDAFETVKELDSVMTETAVVTDFSVGDMWEKLPEYAEQANELGASIRDLYAANTLYFQQGLNSQQAMSVGVETMKMARIANMDAAQATEAMTAALRGFNMEIDNTSATKINDVYSELAAVTAADTSQIATAMSKTASIAASANMEFETTAALLAQIIETTQEAPETAGTAMKTIIARFTEVKQLFSEGMLTGKDDEGEEININKIDAALKTVGISLKDFLNGAKGIDEIFLELASKWNTLDLATQRYIATTAAGSRQQSRFLAMMSNYDRTMELVTAANKSAGASQKQFEKTLDSLDAKLQKLKNAWDTFTMGLADSDLIKGGVDLLSGLLDAINNLTNAFDGVGGSIAKVMVIVGALNLGKRLISTFSGQAYSAGETVGGKFAIGLAQSLTKISKIQAEENLKANLEGINSTMGMIAKSSMAAGLGLKFVAQQLENAGYEDAAKTVSMFGNGVLVVSGALQILNPILAATGMTFSQVLAAAAPFLPTIALATGAVVLLAGAYGLLTKNSPEKSLERAKKYSEEAGKAAEEAAQKYDELKKSLSNLSSAEKDLENLTIGTQEWKEAVIQLNNEVLNLIDKFPELAKAGLVGFENGHLTIDYESEAGQAYLNAQQRQTSMAQMAAIFSQESLAKQEKEYYYYEQVYRDSPFANQELAEQFAKDVFSKPEFFSGVNQQGLVIDWLKSNELDQMAQDAALVDALVDSLEQFYDYGQVIYESDLKSKTYDQAIQTQLISQIDTSGYDANVINFLSQMAMPISEYAKKIIEKDYKEATIVEDENLKKEYAEALFGENAFIQSDGIDYTIYSQDLQESITLGFTELEDALSYYKATQDYGKTQLEDAAKLYSKMDTEQRTNISKLTSQDGQGMDLTLMREISESNGIAQYVKKEFQLNQEDFEKAFGITFNEIEKNLEKAAINNIKEKNKLVKQLSKYSSHGYQSNAQALAALEKKFGEQIDQTIESVLASLELTGDEDLISKGFMQFRKITSEGDLKDVQQIASFINNINWNDPIEAAARLNKELKVGTDLTKAYSLEILNANSSFLNANNQLQYFLKSADFSEMEESLNGIVEKNGEIAGSDILDLAQDYKSLNKILDNTEVTAEGLAKALTLVHQNKLGLHQLTEPVLAILDSFESLDSLVLETSQIIQNFDPGIDENQFAEFINTAYETISKNLKAGAVGNTQNFKYLDFLFPGWRKSGKDLEYFVKQLEANASNMRTSWADIAKGKDAFGNDISLEGEYQNDIKIEELEDGSISLTGFEGMTTNELVSWIADAYNVSKNYAQMMLADFKNYSKDLAMELMKNDYSTGIKEAYEKLGQIENKKFADQSTIQAISEISGRSEKEIEQDLRDQYGEGKEENFIITNFFDENNLLKSAEEILTELDKVAADHFGSDKGWLDMYISNGKVDLANLEQDFEKISVPNEVRDSLTQSMIDSLLAGAEEGAEKASVIVQKTLSDGKTYDLEVTSEIDLATAIANQEMKIDQQGLAQETAAAFAPSLSIIESKMDDIIAAINGIDPTVTVDMPVMRTQVGPKARIMRAFAGGIKNSPKKYDSLVSEKGPELIQKADGGAYLTGQNGPEIARIEKGDTVYTAEETRDILKKRKHSIVPRYAVGYDNVKTSGSGNGDDNNDENIWKNSIDKLYNLIREIDEELRQRERIERRYEKLLESIDSSANKIINVSLEELDQLEEERKLQEQLIAGRKDQIAEYLKENSDLNAYANVTQNDRGEDVLRIDWALIDAITDKDEGQRVDEYLKQLEDWFNDLKGAEDALWDIEDAVDEIKQRGKEEYFELEETIKEAIVQSYEEEINKLSEINDSINDTNSSLLDAIQSSIDKQRQDRDNARTEEELAEKQRRLLYLQQDTSGANAKEILSLQDEIARGQEDYTDSLIDQKISELQEQNNKAAEQREQQISVLETQLDQLQKSGAIWDQVYSLMDEGLDKDGGLVRGSQLEAILKNADSFSGLSAIGKMEWLNETNGMIAQALAYLEVGRQLESIGLKEGTSISFTNQNGQKLSGIVDKDGNVIATDGQIYDNVYQGADGSYYAGKSKEKAEESFKDEQSVEPITPAAPIHPNWTEDNIIGIAEAIWEYGRDASGWGAGNERWRKIDEKIGTGASDEVQDRINQIAANKIKTGFAKKKLSEYFYGRFKQGGLADFTGPAWLDGTKARPEIVLDAQDSRNFIQLRDILGSLLNRSVNNTSTENNGDIIYDIDINVESIGSDYDVDQVANKIKSLINEDARYRNNNAVSLRR